MKQAKKKAKKMTGFALNRERAAIAGRKGNQRTRELYGQDFYTGKLDKYRAAQRAEQDRSTVPDGRQAPNPGQTDS